VHGRCPHLPAVYSPRRSPSDPLLLDASGWTKPDIMRSQSATGGFPDCNNAAVTKGFVTAHEHLLLIKSGAVKKLFLRNKPI